MIWYFWLLVGLIVPLAFIVLWTIIRSQDKHGYDHTATGVLAIIAVVLYLIWGGLVGGVNAARHMTREDCVNWSVSNGRPAHFASYTFWDFGCVTPDGHGGWIPTTQIIVNVPSK